MNILTIDGVVYLPNSEVYETYYSGMKAEASQLAKSKTSNITETELNKLKEASANYKSSWEVLATMQHTHHLCSCNK